MKKITIQTFERLFFNNTQFETFERIPFLDSLAYTIQEYLYSEKADDDDREDDLDFRLDSRIRTFDFMTLAAHFISAADTDLWKATITDYIEVIKLEFKIWEQDIVMYPSENTLAISSASVELRIDLLWATYIYAKTLSTFKDDVKWAKRWERKATELYAFMLEKSGVVESYFKGFAPIKNTEEAVQCMRKQVIRKLIKEEKTQNIAKSPVDSTSDSAQLQARIKELEEELEAYKEKKKGINQHLTALFGIKLAELLGITYTNKKTLAPMLSKLFGWGTRKLEQELCKYFSNEDDLELANIFGKLSPDVAKKICPNWEDNNSSENANSSD